MPNYYLLAFSSILNVVPLPNSELFTNILPLWYSSTMRLARLRPKHQPRLLVVKPGLKTMRKSFFLIPLPVSLTSTITRSPMVSTRYVIVPDTPPLASTAFLQMFSITHSNSEALRRIIISLSGKTFTI